MLAQHILRSEHYIKVNTQKEEIGCASNKDQKNHEANRILIHKKWRIGAI